MATATSSSRSTRGRQQTARRGRSSTTGSSSKTATTSSATTSSAQSSRQSSGSSGRTSAQTAKQSQGTTVELPFVTAQFHKPDVHLPGREDFTSAAETVRSQLPSRDQALFYGGLAAGAAFSLIEWPVAVAIGVGTALVNRTARQQHAE